MNPITSHPQMLELGGFKSRSQIKRQRCDVSPASPNITPSFNYVSNPTGSTPVLKVKPIKCSRNSGLHTEKPEEKGKGRLGCCSGREPWRQETPLCSPSPQGHLLLWLLPTAPTPGSPQRLVLSLTSAM